MTDAVTISLIGAVGSFMAAALSVANNILGRRNEQHIAEAKETIVTLEKNTNSIKDALIAVTAKSSKAEGKLEGRAEVKAEQANGPEEHSG